MKKRAIVCVTNDLATDQRVQKTCKTLKKCGYEVVEYGRILPKSLTYTPDYQIKRYKLFFNRGPLFYIEYNIRLFFFLLFSKVNLIVSNDLDTLLACFLASKLKRAKLIYDTHEYFTEVPELIARPKVQNIWLKLEKWIFPKLEHIVTVNDSIAEIYKKKYNKNIVVIKNAPEYKEDSKKTEDKSQKIIIYQGALNIGRGLEILIKTMNFLPEFQLQIYGKGDIEHSLKELAERESETNNIFFMGEKSPSELREITPKASFGWCVMENLGKNYYYSLPNRVFDYMHAGVAIIANDFPEIKKIVEKYESGIIIDDFNPETIAKKIAEVNLESFSKEHFDNISKQNCWQIEEKKLTTLIDNI